LSPVEYYDEGGRRVNLWSLVQPEDFFEDAQEACLRVMKPAMEAAFEEVRDRAVDVPRYGRSGARQDQRNGYYVRKRVETAVGTVEGLRVPRCRRLSLAEEVIERLGQAKGALEGKVVDMYLMGVSTRNVGELLDGLVGVGVSAGRVSQLALRLDAQVARFHTRPLEDRYVYLFLDAIWLKSRNVPALFRAAGEARRRMVLVAYGVSAEGQKELIDYRLEKSESAAAWGRFLASLYQRGLRGGTLEAVVTDGGRGLLAVLGDWFPDAVRQRCWFHKMANVMVKLRKRNIKGCLTGLRQVYRAASRAAAERAYVAWARRWRQEEEAAVRCVEADLDDLLAFYGLPQAHWRMLRTTNVIERCFREVRRRTRSIGCFMNNASIERLVYGLFSLLNERRAGKVCREFKAATVAA